MPRSFDEPLLGGLPLVDVFIDQPQCVRDALKSRGKSPLSAIRCAALVDSGSSHSAISSAIVSRFGLRPSNRLTMTTPRGQSAQNIFRVRLSIMMTPSPLVLDPFNVTEMNWGTLPFEAIIGLDILKLGVFTLDGANGRCKLEMP